jgi:hypothetical protein
MQPLEEYRGDPMQRYGHIDETTDAYPLAAWIWGHRLRTGQHWIEYLLEFLNVLAGFEYQFGQGLDLDPHPENGYLTHYKRFTRLGLRRFIFYDERDKSTNPRDDEAIERLREHLVQIVETGEHPEHILHEIRTLLRSFSAIEEDRSWYAKSLFPAHEAFLFWEALRKEKGKRSGKTQIASIGIDDAEPFELDKGVTFTDRNFFARGGELYYLILSAGTEQNPQLRSHLADRLKALLHTQNHVLGTIAETIDSTWSTLRQDTNGEQPHRGTVGWITDPECPLYRQIAEDLETFLDNHLDSLECLDLLAHLICFHILQYIYHRAHPASTTERHTNGFCRDACRPALLIDLLDQRDNGVLRAQSANFFREQEQHQIDRARSYVFEQLARWALNIPDDQQLLDELATRVEQHFSFRTKKSRDSHRQLVERLRTKYETQSLNQPKLLRDYCDAIFQNAESEFERNFLGVHRTLAKAIGFVAPRKGQNARFVLGDNLLKALVLANLGPNEQMRLGEFLERLYLRYGLVIGLGEASAANLVNRLRINTEYYERNRTAFLNKLQRAGLVTQYSDATALVHRG